jgi:3-isopropylmalate/(R)-2-methylmalate dehydratase small subunit
VSPETGRALLDAVAADPTLEITVDLQALRVEAPAAGIEEDFPLDPFTQHRLLEGLDDIGLTLRFTADIDAYEARRAGWLPAVT